MILGGQVGLVYWIRSECKGVSQVAVLKAGSAQCCLRHFGWDLKPNPDVIVVLLVLRCEALDYATRDHQHIRAFSVLTRGKQGMQTSVLAVIKPYIHVSTL